MQTANLNHKQDAHTNNGAYPQSYTSHRKEDPERGDGKVGFVRDVLLRGEGRGGEGGGGKKMSIIVQQSSVGGLLTYVSSR